MANVNELIPIILKWEGGYVNDPDDLGGATNKGITLNTFKYYRKINKLPDPTIDDLMNIKDSEWLAVLKSLYWNKWQADKIKNQSVANILVDWVWASGGYGIKWPQKLLGVDQDGIVGTKTLTAVNEYPQGQQVLFNELQRIRIEYIDWICSLRTTNRKFRNGWLNRINSFHFKP